MKTSKLILGTLAAAVIVGGTLMLNSKASDLQQGFSRRGPIVQKIIQHLELTDSQVQQIKAVLRSEKSRILPLLSDLQAARLELRKTIQQPVFNEDAVRQASLEVAEVEQEISVLRADLYSRIRPILTEKQAARIQKMQDRMDLFLDGVIRSVSERIDE